MGALELPETPLHAFATYNDLIDTFKCSLDAR